MHTTRNSGWLDRFRILAALLVAAIHTSPLASVSEGADFFLTRVLARIAVPFFLMVTGQFVAAGFLAPSVKTYARFHKFLQKTALLYVFCSLLYLPIGIYAGHFNDVTVVSVLRMVVFDGTFYHLWYFPACILGLLLVDLMSRFLSLKGMTLVSFLLYVIGLFGDSYYGLVQKVPFLEKFYEGLFGLFSYTRNGLFMAPLFLVLGMWMSVRQENGQEGFGSSLFAVGQLAVSFAVMAAEAFTLRHFELQRHDSMYFALIPVMFFLYQCLLRPEKEPKKSLRTAAGWIYILHPAVIVAVRGIAKVLDQTALLVENSLVHYTMVALLSIAAGFTVSFLSERLQPLRLFSRMAESRKQYFSNEENDEAPYEYEEQETTYQEGQEMQDTEYRDGYENWDEENGDFSERIGEFGTENENTEGWERSTENDDTEGWGRETANDDTEDWRRETANDDTEDWRRETANDDTGDWGRVGAEQFQEDGQPYMEDTAAENFFPESMPEELPPQNADGFNDSIIEDSANEIYAEDIQEENVSGNAYAYAAKAEGMAKTDDFAPNDMPDSHGKESEDDRILKIMSGKTIPYQMAAIQQGKYGGQGNAAVPTGETAEIPGNTREEAPDLPEENPCSRAWIELDAEALATNVEFFRSRIPERCRLMPAVKADAYGHGIVPVSRILNGLGVDAFCVACISEGITLRKAGISGKILILGYTAPEDFLLLRRYHLIQTVVDAHYAEELHQSGEKLHVHIGIDTGMHRIGIRCENIEEITAVYQMENLVIEGIFTHLCVSDSPHPEDKAFTAGQLRAFYQVIDILKENGYPCPGLHILASYGILNLLYGKNETALQARRPTGGRAGLDANKLAADFVRPGIALYGVLSTQTDQNVWKDSLKPVLSLKARVTSLRPLYAGESVSYGITYTAAKDMQVAAIAIGYADGLPRELSNGRGWVLLHGRRAPIIGRICMDQCIVDVTGIPKVKRGDTAVIIGRSGKEEITAAMIAETCGTITHEVLTGLAPRLGRVVVEREVSADTE